MPDYHPQAELAPRDVVARAIVTEMAGSGSDRVYLDITHLPPEKVSARFPQIYRFCLEHKLDITGEPIPVSPAAHYTMGGVRTNTWGETNLAGLYACGEAACMGLHGANRLASNSLLETVVFAKRVVRRTVDSPGTPAPTAPDARVLTSATSAEAPRADRTALQALMWEKAGIVRDGPALAEATRLLSAWDAALPPPSDRPSHELANLVLAGRLVTEGALQREESRGAHYRRDFPEPRSEWLRHTVFCRHA
jgi:L-aspartate oxidase